MKTKKKNIKYIPGLRDRIENFLHSDTIPATATKYMLMFLALGSVVIGGAIVPGMIKLLEKRSLFEDETGYGEKQIKNAIYRLRRQKLVEIIKSDDKKMIVRLTNKGKERVRKFSIDTIVIQEPKVWDGKWRILIFDIPTKLKNHNLAREALRSKIKELGFQQLQKSVWIFPFECEDEILFIAELFEVQQCVEIITAEKLLQGDGYKKIFELA